LGHEAELSEIRVAEIHFFADGTCGLAIPFSDEHCAAIYPAIAPALAVIAVLSAKTTKFEAVAKLLRNAYVDTPSENLRFVCGVEFDDAILKAHEKYKNTTEREGD